MSDPQIPAALLPAVAGITSLHDFVAQPQVIAKTDRLVANVPGSSAQPHYGSGGSQALAPADYATIYNVKPLYNAGINGSGTVIAIIGRTNINVQDVLSFRKVFGLVSNPPNIIVNGSNPGDLGGGEELEAVLDTSWAGAVTPNAKIDLVVSASTNSTDGVFLSEEYIITVNATNLVNNWGGSSASTLTGWYKLVSENSGLCLNVAGNSSSEGANIIQWTCGAYTNEYFSFTPVSGGYEITAQNSGLCVNVSGNSLSQGAQIIQWPYWGATYTNEVWTVSAPDTKGYVTIAAVSSGRVLSVYDSSLSNGASIIRWGDLEVPAQKWMLVQVTP